MRKPAGLRLPRGRVREFPCSRLPVEKLFGRLEHDPEKWLPVFRKRSCSNKNVMTIRRKVISL